MGGIRFFESIRIKAKNGQPDKKKKPIEKSESHLLDRPFVLQLADSSLTFRQPKSRGSVFFEKKYCIDKINSNRSGCAQKGSFC